MAATLLTVYPSKISTNSIVTTGGAIDGTNGNVFTNTGHEVLVIQTGATNAVTPVITPLGKVLNAVPAASPYAQIPVATTVVLGPFDPGVYNGNTSSGVTGTANQVAVMWTGTTAGTNVWVLQVPDAKQPS